jgi:hypothetical protein
MVMSISLLPLLVHALIVSGALAWLNTRGVAMSRAAAATLIVSAAIWAITQVTFGGGPPSWRDLQYWTLFVALPSAVVLLASRIGALQTRSWWLIAIGPVMFICATTVVIIVYNVLFANSRQQ